MAEPTLAQVFGANATQDGTTITIRKSDLTAAGFTPSSSNTAESILAAIIKRNLTVLTPTAQSANADQNITVVTGFDSLETRNSVQYYNTGVTVTFSYPQSAPGIAPDNY